MDAVHVHVSGRVQGVGFRYHIIRQAEGLRLDGFVRNLADGRVEIWAEGSSKDVAALVDAARSGPSPARVSHVAARPVEPTGSFHGFEVRG